jgi:hypothetical protein
MEPIELPIEVIPFESIFGVSLGARAKKALSRGHVTNDRIVQVDDTTKISITGTIDAQGTLSAIEVDWSATPSMFFVHAHIGEMDLAGRRFGFEREVRKLGHEMRRNELEAATYCIPLGLSWTDRNGDVIRVAIWDRRQYEDAQALEALMSATRAL